MQLVARGLTGLQFFKRQVIDRDGEVYLRRWILLRCDRFAVYLHKFERGDEDPAPHDHPWDFTSIVLWGGYTEEFWKPVILYDGGDRSHAPATLTHWVARRFGSIGKRPAEHLHRVCEPYGPCWTLVICGPRRRQWGFQTPRGWVEWRTFLGLDAPEGSPSNVERNQ